MIKIATLVLIFNLMLIKSSLALSSFAALSLLFSFAACSVAKVQLTQPSSLKSATLPRVMFKGVKNYDRLFESSQAPIVFVTSIELASTDFTNLVSDERIQFGLRLFDDEVDHLVEELSQSELDQAIHRLKAHFQSKLGRPLAHVTNNYQISENFEAALLKHDIRFIKTKPWNIRRVRKPRFEHLLVNANSKSHMDRLAVYVSKGLEPASSDDDKWYSESDEEREKSKLCLAKFGSMEACIFYKRRKNY